MGLGLGLGLGSGLGLGLGLGGSCNCARAARAAVRRRGGDARHGLGALGGGGGGGEVGGQLCARKVREAGGVGVVVGQRVQAEAQLRRGARRAAERGEHGEARTQLEGVEGQIRLGGQ